jgi:colanic acid biosynthesis glycosyl transferase WcaI
MNVLITTQVYPPEGHPTAIMVHELATELCRLGAQVTVAAGFPHHPYGRLYPGFRKHWLLEQEDNGFRVIRGWHLIHPSPALTVRGLVMASQSAAFFLAAATCPAPDVVINFGPPLFGPLTSALIAQVSGARLVTVVYDLYPDILVDVGLLRQPLLIRAARAVEGLVYRLSDRIVVLSQGFRRTLVQDKHVPPQKVEVIPVWLDAQDIVPMPRDNAWRREMGISAKTFVVLYAGTIGLVSGAEVVVEAAAHLKEMEDLLFLLVGTGSAKEQVEALAQEADLSNIRFLPFQPREKLSEVQATADVALVTLAPGRGRTSVPSKVLGYLAAARPVLAAVDQDCDTANLIREADCGLVTPPANGELLAAGLRELYDDSLRRREMGSRGRAYFEKHLEKRQVLASYGQLIEQVSNER